MANYVKYEPAIENMLSGAIVSTGTTNQWSVAIHTDAPTVATDDELADLTQIAGSNGYTTGGADVQNSGSRAGATYTVAGSDIVWTASGANLGASTTGRYFSMYDNTSTGDKLIASWDYGATFTVADGETMTFDVGASLFTAA